MSAVFDKPYWPALVQMHEGAMACGSFAFSLSPSLPASFTPSLLVSFPNANFLSFPFLHACLLDFLLSLPITSPCLNLLFGPFVPSLPSSFPALSQAPSRL